jgi:hypothetical protein
MANKKFRILRNLLYSLGLSKKSSNEVVDWIVNLRENEKDDSVSTDDAISKQNNTASLNSVQTKLPYAKRDDFLSAAELNFYRVLIHTLGNQATVFTKVGLSDIFYVESKDRSEHQTFFNKIDRKHVDFLLCDADTLEPICGIELDDKSHQRKDRQERDRFVNAVFEISELPLIHIPVSQSYVTSKLHKMLSSYIDISDEERGKDDASKLIDELFSDDTDASPTCHKCGSEMILRTAKRGENAGRQFWGCSNYPHCRAMINVESMQIDK